MTRQNAMGCFVYPQHGENEENRRPVSEEPLRAVWKRCTGTKGIDLKLTSSQQTSQNVL